MRSNLTAEAIFQYYDSNAFLTKRGEAGGVCTLHLCKNSEKDP